MSSAASRKLIHAGEMDFTDVHLSVFARNLMYGFYGDIDVAVVEVSRIRPDGSVILTSSVGISAEALAKAKKIILEVNTAVPDYTGFHDIVAARRCTRTWAGRCRSSTCATASARPTSSSTTRKVVAVVESQHARLPGALQGGERHRPPHRPERHRLPPAAAASGSTGASACRPSSPGWATWPTPSSASSTTRPSRRSASGPRCSRTG